MKKTFMEERAQAMQDQETPAFAQ